jgi:hypothetical protein
MALDLNDNSIFINEFYKKVDELKIDWHVKGLISPSKSIYALGSDSKLVGRIFEIITAPIIKAIAEEHNYIVVIPEQQNTYPDFTLMRDENDRKKIAIDVKTTYKLENRVMGYTLGSYTSFIRNNTKNIQFPYNQYKEHYIIGFAYKRNNNAKEGEICDINKIDYMDFPYTDVEFFVQTKKNISGDKPGSGNTENIGSFGTNNFNDFQKGNGPFSNLPNEVFNHYWANYPRYRNREQGNYQNLVEYFDWLDRIKHPYSKYRKEYDNWLDN